MFFIEICTCVPWQLCMLDQWHMAELFRVVRLVVVFVILCHQYHIAITAMLINFTFFCHLYVHIIDLKVAYCQFNKIPPRVRLSKSKLILLNPYLSFAIIWRCTSYMVCCTQRWLHTSLFHWQADTSLCVKHMYCLTDGLICGTERKELLGGWDDES